MSTAEHIGPDTLAAVLAEQSLTTLFQPLVSAADGRLFGYESLLRGPANSTLHAPMDLFAAARECGRLAELDLLALRVAIERFMAGQYPGKLFVNLLPQTLATFTGFSAWVRELLASNSMPCERLVIEITEHGEQLDAEATRKQFTQLRLLGCQIAIDDFGTGLSGLKIWSELRPDFVKVDRYFTSQIEKDPVAIEVLRAMLDMAHVLGSRVVAEGIESAGQLELLRGIGVDYLQGYYICRPLAERTGDTGTFELAPMQVRTDVGVSCVGELCVPREPLSPATRIADAVSLFQARPEWECIPVVDEGRPVGILRRDALLLLLSRPLHPEIYNPKPVARIMEKRPTLVDERTRLGVASRLITRNRRSRINEDFIVTRDGLYLGLARGVDLLHHITEQQVHDAQQSNPLTLLPGNREIDATLQRMIALRVPFALCHADVDHFKPFNDQYGYRQGDQVLLHLAGLCRSIAVEELDFVGHAGGDDFILILRSHDWRHRLARLVENFSASCARFYSVDHRAAGGFVGLDRDGRERRYPLMSLSVGGVAVDPCDHRDPAELMQILSAAKRKAKARDGSAVILHQDDRDQTMRLPALINS